MCYSAQVYADWKKFTRMFGAGMSVGEFYRTFWTRNEGVYAQISENFHDATRTPNFRAATSAA